jgi:hypothetical protein
MSVNFIPILVDEKVLTDEIVRLRQTLPPEKIDEAIQEAWRNDALPKHESENRFEFRRFRNFDNTHFWNEAGEIRLQILFAAWEAQYTSQSSNEILRSADALYQFLGAFHYQYCNNNVVNDYGLTGSCAISPVNSRRLHELFKRIDFELLRPIFVEHCKGQCYMPGELTKYDWIPSIDVLKNYAAAFDGLVAEAAEKNKVLYMWASF